MGGVAYEVEKEKNKKKYAKTVVLTYKWFVSARTTSAHFITHLYTSVISALRLVLRGFAGLACSWFHSDMQSTRADNAVSINYAG